MRRRTLGRTGLEVSELALGGLFVATELADRQRGCDTIHRAMELGINYIDTAPGYLDSEAVIGEALAGIEAPLVLSTKLGGRPRPFDAKDPAALRWSLEESLRLLGRDRVDLLMIHEPDRPGQYDWWTDYDRAEGPVMGVLDELRHDGVIGAIGLGGTTVYDMVRLVNTARFDVVLTAFNYSLLFREGAHVIDAAARQGMGIVVGSPLQQGALARRFDAQIASGLPWLSPARRAQYRALYDLLDETGIALPEMGLRFVLSNPLISCTLMGARSPGEAEQNAAAAERGPLPGDLLRRLDEIAAMVPFRPAEEPFGLPLGGGYGGRGEGR